MMAAYYLHAQELPFRSPLPRGRYLSYAVTNCRAKWGREEEGGGPETVVRDAITVLRLISQLATCVGHLLIIERETQVAPWPPR